MKVIAAFITTLLVTATPAEAEQFGPYKANLVRVVDGDTIDFDIKLWPRLTQRARIRVSGINTPEKRTRVHCEKAAGIAATEFTQSFLDTAQKIIITDVRDGKYAGRQLGNVYVDGNSLSEALLNAGHARPYDGGSRSAWCED